MVNQETNTKLTNELTELIKKRCETVEEILYTERELFRYAKDIAEQELTVKIQLEKEISEADQATLKTKYSNAEKRRLALEKALSSDEKLYTLKKRELEVKQDLHILATTDRINKIKERFLFKQVDLLLGGHKE